MNVDRSIMIHLCSSRRTVFISVCFFFSLSHLCLWTWPWEKPFEFYRNAYRQASSLFNTLLGFALGIHVAQRFISLKKRNRTLRLSALGHRRWGNGNQSLSHFPAVRVPSGATQTTITASLPHHVVKPFSALVFFFFSFRCVQVRRWLRLQLHAQAERVGVLRVVEVGTTAAMQRAKLRPLALSRTSPFVWELLSPYPDVGARSF